MSKPSQVGDGAVRERSTSVLHNSAVHESGACTSNCLEKTEDFKNPLEMSCTHLAIDTGNPVGEDTCHRITQDETVVTIITGSCSRGNDPQIEAVPLHQNDGEGKAAMTAISVSPQKLENLQVELDNLPTDIMVRMLRATALVGVECMVRMGSVSKKFSQALLELQTQDPSVLWGVRQNQRIYQEIQRQLVRERSQSGRLNFQLIKAWTGTDGSPSFWKILFEHPSVFPYHPASVCICVGLIQLIFSWKKLLTEAMMYDRALLALLGLYGGVIGFTGIFCLLSTILSSRFFLTGLSVLFFHLLAAKIAVVVSCITVLTFDGSRYACVLVAFAFMMSLWTIILHARSGFETGMRRAYATGCFILATVSVWLII